MLINEIAKITGISAHTIRFYEKSGLIEGKRDESIKSNNYFHYDEETIKNWSSLAMLSQSVSQ
jgi:DNA-binding transcriptional MerR regulator